PPKKLPSGEWMMSRRDHRAQVSMLIGGIEGFDQWEIVPVSSYGGKKRPEEPFWYILPDGKNIVALFRDNGGSKRLFRAFSTDNGRSWSKLTKTNFTDATSKFNVLRTSRGYYVLGSNPSPHKRDPLALSVSKDGMVYTSMFYLVGGRHVDYPHIIEHEGDLFISFSGAKQTVEVLKVSLDDIDKMVAESAKPASK
ncbi:MAG: exo-alpha-sialidase, partial [Planctomycetota bacterium]|nr:exo-alpha-sialidase [Planctomycetota bacterium]